MNRRYLLRTTVALAVLLAVVPVFTAPPERASILVDLLTGLAWPLVLLIAVVVFWPQLRTLAAEVVARTQKGAGLRIGMIELERLPLEQLQDRIPEPAGSSRVTLKNIALLHTSFLRADKTTEFADGRTYYQFEVIIIAPRNVMERVTAVTYRLEDAWPEEYRERTVIDRASRFKLKELANGTSIVNAKVQVRGQDEPLLLNRFIDLRPDGPRL